MTTTRSRTLSAAELDAFGAELDALRERGDAPASARPRRSYIRRVQAIVRYTEIGGRGLLFVGWLPPAWLAGTGLLGVQQDRRQHGARPQRHARPVRLDERAVAARRHLRVGPRLRRRRLAALAQLHAPRLHQRARAAIATSATASCASSRRSRGSRCTSSSRDRRRPGDALPVGHRAARPRARRGRARPGAAGEAARESRPVLRKALRQFAKDYVVFPLLAGPAFLPVLAGNLAANLIRNLWTFGIIFCGHFTADAETFPETRARGRVARRLVRAAAPRLEQSRPAGRPSTS